MREPITIVVTTWFPPTVDGNLKLQAALQTVVSWDNMLFYDGEVKYHIADDGSDEYHLSKFIHACERLFPDKVTTSLKSKQGVGASMNRGMVGPTLFAYFVDDWFLTENFDLTKWADELMNNPSIGMVRFGPPHPGISGTAELVSAGWILRLNRHNFTYGMRPALYHKRFIDAYGLFLERASSVEVERLYNEHFARTPGPDIVLTLESKFDNAAYDVCFSEIDPTQREE